MADYYSNSPNAPRSRFGFRFNNSSEGSNASPTDPWASSDLFAKTDRNRDHVCRPVVIGSDGRAVPVAFDCPSIHHHKEATTLTEGSAYRVQPVSPLPGDRKMGFPGGLFRRPRAEYEPTEPALITEGGWTRPSPNGWKLPPEEPLRLGRVTHNIDSASEYQRGSARPISSSGWAGPTPRGRLERVTNDISTAAGHVMGPTTTAGAEKASATTVIDSREAVRRYGGQYI